MDHFRVNNHNDGHQLHQGSEEQSEQGRNCPGIKAGLATATPQDQKQLLGERLFPQIQRMNSDLADKLTGMMLEKSNEEILQMMNQVDDVC